MMNQVGRTANPLDRNNDGKVDLKDLTGQPGYNQQGLMGQQRTANPLDRNNDGRVDLKDLTGQRATGLNSNDRNMNGIPDNLERNSQFGADRNMNGIPDSQERLSLGQQGFAGGFNDRNMNGIPDSQERLGQTGLVGGLNDRNHNGIPDSQERLGGMRHNPLDRNHDGRVDLKDLKSTDRNHNGIPDSQERFGQTGLVGGLNDRNHNGIPDSQERLGGMRHNPLDRNFDGRVDAKDFVGTSTSSTGFLREAPIAREVVQKNVVVHEHIHPVEKEEIQPVIYREREQLDVKQITQQLHETQIQPTLIQQRELAPEYREAIVARGAPIQENLVLPSVDRDATLRSQVVHAPIVNETIKKTVIEEIQPVLERDIIQSTLIQETKNIYEKVIEAPTVYRETRVIQERGISGGSLQNLAAQGFNLGSYQSGFSNDRNMNGIPDNLERNSQFGNDRNMNGIPDNLEGGMRHNPLDRNHDGRVNLQDLKSTDRNHNGIPDSQERFGQTGLVGGLNDRNHNGIPDSQERLGLGQQGFVGGLNDRNHNGIPDSQERFGQTGLGGLNDRNHNGIPDSQERLGQGLLPGQGLMGQRTANPLDRNNDGRVDLKDLTGQPGYNQQGLVGQQGLMGQQRTANPLDRNNDGRVDLKDLTGQQGYNQQGLGQQGLMGQRTANPLDRNNDGKVDLRDLAANKAAPVGAQAPLRTL